MLVLIRYKYRLLSQIHKILSSTNLNNILSSSNPHIFVFLIFTFVNLYVSQNLSFESRLSKVSLMSKLSKHCFVFGHFWLFSQNNQPTVDWKFKNDRTKRLQRIPRKINVSLSLAKRKLAEKNEWNLSNQSCEVTHASIYLTNCIRSFVFFQLPYLEHDLMITNLVRLNLIFWKYWRRPRNILVLC